MNRRLIKKVLQQKHEDFVLSIKDERVQKLVKENSIITGGCITSMLLNEKVNDFDYYFTDLESCPCCRQNHSHTEGVCGRMSGES